MTEFIDNSKRKIIANKGAGPKDLELTFVDFTVEEVAKFFNLDPKDLLKSA